MMGGLTEDSIGHSKKEVTVRQLKLHFLEGADTVVRQYDEPVKGHVHSGSSSETIVQ